MSRGPEREWRIDGEHPVTGEVTAEQFEAAFLEAAVIQHRLGGAVQVVPLRERVGDRFVTYGLVFRWESFVPLAPRDVPAAEGDHEGESDDRQADDGELEPVEEEEGEAQPA